MLYRISVPDPDSHFLEIQYIVSLTEAGPMEVQLPAWRPGRYEIQNFAKNIRTLSVTDDKGNPISFQKISKDRWKLQVPQAGEIVISYSYYANTRNAGSSYVDQTLWYLNFINFCLYTEGRIQEPCIVELDLPASYRVACGLPSQQRCTLTARDYYHLVDSPLLASDRLQQYRYVVNRIPFYVWFYGDLEPDAERLCRDFSAFTEQQLAVMEEFPEQEYHFLNLVLPNPFYHGVEHRNSTMVVLGPHHEGEGLYQDLLGVSSHELFHAWNIIRIRPVELLPYDFTKENYFTTCFVAEGCTTYYGDLFLRRAGLLDDAAYFKEIQVYMTRHFGSSAKASQSLIESSFDLWLDGYETGIPQRKVSVYYKGALAALILDLHIRSLTGHGKSLDDVMRALWKKFGKPFTGYKYEDYVAVVEEVAGRSLEWYWSECIRGNVPLEDRLNEALGFVGLSMQADAQGLVTLEVSEEEEARNHREKWLERRRLGSFSGQG